MGEKNFWEKVGIIDKNKSGDSNQKKPRGAIKSYVEKNGDKSYIDSVIKEAEVNSEELDKQIKKREGRETTVSREHSDPVGYKEDKLASEAEELAEEKKIRELKNQIGDILK